jgi:hypothetical protein
MVRDPLDRGSLYEFGYGDDRAFNIFIVVMIAIAVLIFAMSTVRWMCMDPEERQQVIAEQQKANEQRKKDEADDHLPSMHYFGSNMILWF